MIIVRLQGGMGNQMFQYALGRALSIKNNTELGLDLTFLLDRTPIPNFTFRDYNLGDFNIQADIVSKKDIPFLYRKYSLGIFIRYIDFIRRKFINTPGKEKKNYFFDSKIMNLGSNAYLEGWWQNQKYFLEIKDILRKDFTLKNYSEKMKQFISKIESQNSVCVHIRRGDYLTVDTLGNKYYSVLDETYYKNALDIISKNGKIDCIYVFDRDDIDWCKQNVKFNYPTIYIENDINLAETVTLMSACKHFIMANSSFSWWGAWLGNAKEKVVIAPKKWLTDPSIDTSDLIPKEWIRL
ncbi:MAG: alpha-1,2-fucosyltransferase [Patescibacteria group bacterium]